MVVLLSSSLKDFSESFLATPILPCTADERDQSYKNLMKTLTKWFRNYIFWMNNHCCQVLARFVRQSFHKIP
jgi:hypothetical protein